MKYLHMMTLAMGTLAGCSGTDAHYVYYSQAPAVQNVDYAGLPGRELVQRLQNPTTCSLAFYELWRRGGSVDGDDKSAKACNYATFAEKYRQPRLVFCPQDHQPPWYAVVYKDGNNDESTIWGRYRFGSLAKEDDFKTPRRQELFPLMAGKPGFGFENYATVLIFNAEGRPLSSAIAGAEECDHQLVQLADLNGDGICERVDLVTRVNSCWGYCSVLCISPLRPKAMPSLSVLFNWQTNDWGCQFTDADRDGIYDVEFGPWRSSEIGAIDVKAVYHWDKRQKAYAGPDGQPGQHFQRLPAGPVPLEVQRLEKAGQIFLPDPKAEAKKKEALAPPKSSPYRYASLKLLTNEQIARYMGENLNAFLDFLREESAEKMVPETFWTMDPKSAALAIAFRSLRPEMRNTIRIAIDDRDGQKPPEAGTIDFSFRSDTCYSLHFAPEGSCLFKAKNDPQFSWFDQTPFFNSPTPILDLRRCEIPYPEARHLAQTAWWLQRIRSSDVSSSYNDEVHFDPPMHVELVWRDGRGRLTSELTDSLQLRQWNGNYRCNDSLNLIEMLITDVMPSRLGERWTALELTHEHGDSDRMTYEIQDIKKLHGFARQFLDLFSLDQSAIPFPVVTKAVEVVREFEFVDLIPKLEKIQKSLPPPSPAAQAVATLEAEITRIEKAVSDKVSSEADKKKLEELEQRHREIVLDADTGNLESLRKKLNSTLAFLREYKSLPELQALGPQENDEFYTRILQRFQEHYQPPNSERLESLVLDMADEDALKELIRKDPQRADKLIRSMPPEKTPIGVVAFAFLSNSPKEIPRQAEWLQTMRAAALDPKLSSSSIAALVPSHQPRRFSEHWIDEILLKRLRQFPTKPQAAAKPQGQNGLDEIPAAPDLQDSEWEITEETSQEDKARVAAEAGLFLARRGHSDCFDAIVAAYANLDDKTKFSARETLLLAMVSLAQQDPVQIKPRLQKIFLPEFDGFSNGFSEMVPYLWMADLRELKPNLEKCANSGPEDESYESYSSQGDDGKYVGLERRLAIARKIVAIWNEEDPATRGRLLLAFRLFENQLAFCDSDEPEYLFRMKSELARLEPVLTLADKQALAGFLAWYREVRLGKLDSGKQKAKEQFISMAREQLKLP